MTQNAYIEVMQERLDWSVQTERYEMAAKLRDLIIYETTDDKNLNKNIILSYLKNMHLIFQDITKQ
jgi:protein-arginine kinase activator protein McsA